MHIRWTAPAAADLERIADYIREKNPVAEREVVRAILEGISNLRTFPHSARPGEVAGTRELVIARYPAYVVVYRVKEEFIEILHVWHGAQDWRD